MGKANIIGTWGETLAANFLRTKGYKILACNYHSRFGEVDLIAKRKNVLAFVEVKLRKSSDYVQAREYVGHQKQSRILATAECWLSENQTTLQPRFDIIEIYAPEGVLTKEPRIIHLEDAFSY